MSEKMKVEIISTDTIKPSSPTPPNLKNFHFSFIDVNMPSVYTGGLFFYGNNGIPNDACDISGKLKKSLSETLTQFYPLAGRINGNVVECNDEGALFVEARVEFSLSDLLVNPNPKSLIVFVPNNGQVKASEWPLVHVQVTFFSCGGFIVGICLSHKLADAKTFAAFVRGWSAAANGRKDAVKPDFMVSRVFPFHDQEPDEKPPENVKSDQKAVKMPEYVTKRFVFDAEKTKTLRNKAGSEIPTRFEAIATLLWRCSVRTRGDINGGVIRPSVLMVPLDLRQKNVSPLLSENSFGNIIAAAFMETDGEMGHEESLKKLWEGKKKTYEKLVKTEPMKTAEEYVETLKEFDNKRMNGAIDGYICTSWARCGFYEADLGFGNPIWMTPNSLNWRVKMFMFFDAKDGEGMEVWVSLKVEDMAAMEKDEELLQFATLNPSVA